MDSFTPLSALAGGALIGPAASFYMLSLGRVAGISGIFASVLPRRPASESGASSDTASPPESLTSSYGSYFLIGLLLAGFAARMVAPTSLPSGTSSLLLAGASGLFVGLGTRLGSGCTSGHGVCGLSRFSKRSLVATLTFMATGILTVAALRAFGALS